MKTTAILTIALGFVLTGCQQREREGDVNVQGTIPLFEEKSPFIAFDIWLKVGSQNDPAGKEGLASLTAGFLEDSSTTEDSYEQILEKLYPMAASYTSSVDKEMTVFRGVVHRDNLEKYYALFKNAILSPAFKKDDFDRVKSRRMDYLRQQRRFSSDEELGKELLSREIFRGTPYEHPEEGYVTSVESITLQDVKDFYAHNYVRNELVVGLAGGYPKGFLARARNDFDTLPEGRIVSVSAPQPHKIDGLHALIVEKDTNATAVSFGFPFSLLRSDNDFYAMMLVNSWLGEHRNSSSHLYQVIRETRGMNYGDYSYIEAYPMGHTRSMPPQNVSRRKQFFQIWIRPISMMKPGDMHNRTLFATRAALRELKKLVDNGLQEETFQTTRKFLKNYTVNYGSTLSRRLGYRIDDAFYHIPNPGHLGMIKSELDKLTLADVNAAIKKHLQVGNLSMVFITRDAGGLKQKLLSGTETAITYPGKKPESVLAEDKIIQAFPIPVKEENIRTIDINQVLEN